MEDPNKAQVRVTPVVLQVLLSLSGGDAHAYGIMKDIEARTGSRMSVGPGSLHYTITRLLEAGLVEAHDGGTEAADSRRKYFGITARGRQVLEAELRVWADTIELARSRDLLPDRKDA